MVLVPAINGPKMETWTGADDLKWIVVPTINGPKMETWKEVDDLH